MCLSTRIKRSKCCSSDFSHFWLLDGQISAVELKNEISSLLFRCLNGTNANIRYRTVKKEHEKTWMVPSPAQIFVTVLFLGEKSWRVQKLPAKFTIPPPPPAGSVSEEEKEEIYLSVLWCVCLNGSEFFAMQWIRKETGNVCLPAEILQGEGRGRAEHV